jgi:hypothetical protein
VISRAFLHTSTWAGVFAYPVEVLDQSKKTARVLLKHQARIGRTTYSAGCTRRVPIDAVSMSPRPGAYVSQGGGRFK